MSRRKWPLLLWVVPMFFFAGACSSTETVRGSSNTCRLTPANCSGGLAGAPCVADADCLGVCCLDGANCGGGMCTFDCADDLDCPADMACQHDKCFYRCEVDDDCAVGQGCEHGNTICEWP